MTQTLSLAGVRLIASDLDGTLLLNGAQTLGPDTCELIRALRARGVYFAAASGRQHSNLRRLFAPVRDEIGYVCENGGLCLWGEETIHREAMEPALMRALIETARQRPNIEILAAGPHLSYTESTDPEFMRMLLVDVGYDIVRVEDLTRLPEDCLKVSFYERGGIRDEKWWQRRFAGRCQLVVSGAVWLDAMAPSVNKALGLQCLLDHLGLPASACMAIGDNDNDREMLQLAGLPATVYSAKPGIRALAAVQTDTVENLRRRVLESIQ